MKGFLQFIREKGVIGLAVGFILGGAITKLVSSFVSDIVNPIVGIVLGFTKGLTDEYWMIGKTRILWGHFITTLIDFLIVSFVVYIGIKVLKLDRLDKTKDK